MSTSYSPALDPKGKPALKPEIHPFLYEEAAATAGGKEAGSRPEEVRGGDGKAEAASRAVREQTAHEAGRQAGEAAARASFEAQLQQSRASTRKAVDDFARERAAYYQQVEGEVVQLALSIARKILHREAQVDPLLLAGIVRVALDQIENNTKVVIRVNPGQGANWREFFSRDANRQNLPEVVDDAALEAGRCVLQTTMGTTELGVEAQLKEIEQGLTDLLAQRPRSGT